MIESRRTALVGLLLAAAALAGCGGGGGGGGNGGEDLPTEATVVAGDERVAHPLAPGRYRLTIQEEDCDNWTVMITQDGGEGFTYEKTNSPIKILFVNDVPAGNFFIEQTDESCSEWEVDMTLVTRAR